MDGEVLKVNPKLQIKSQAFLISVYSNISKLIFTKNSTRLLSCPSKLESNFVNQVCKFRKYDFNSNILHT